VTSADASGRDRDSRHARIHEAIADCLRRRAAGETLADGEVCAAHPDLMPELGEELARRAAPGAGETEAIPAPETGESSPPFGPAGLRDSVPGYRIERKLSEGGQGVVYLAVQTSTRRKVALKMMRAGAFASRSDRARFEREVQVLGRLSHPNIVAIHDSGTAAAGHYIVMDYIAGRPLDQYMLGPGVPASIEDTLRLFRKVCAAINAAHLAGIIHRDLKPSNILIDSAGEPHILDFGLAKVSLRDLDASLMTMTGHFVGSLPWASPEQAEGVPERIDMRTDVYSLGVILYQMLTGQLPYDVTGNMREDLERIIRADPRRPRTIRRAINDEVETMVLKCLSKDRDRRYQTAGELARDLGNYLDGLPIEAKRESVGYLLRKQLRRYRIHVGVGVLLAVLIVTGLVTSTALWHRAAREGATAGFRLEAARQETSLGFDEYRALLRRTRQMEEWAALLPAEVRRRFSYDRPVAVDRDLGSWIEEFFSVSADSASAPGPGVLAPQTVQALAACVREPGQPGCAAAFAWLRTNQDRVRGLVEGVSRYRFQPDLGAQGGRLAEQLLPSLGGIRLAGRILVASAILHHEEGDHATAAAELLASARLARRAGDGIFTIGILVELSRRDQIYSVLRWMVADAGDAGPVPEAYARFLERDLPFPSYEHAYISELRVLRQILSEAYGKAAPGGRPRLDLRSLRQVWADLDPTMENPYSDPTDSMKADADALEYDEAIAIVSGLCDLLRLPDDGSGQEIDAARRLASKAAVAHPALSAFAPDFSRAVEQRRRCRMNRDATVIAMAIHTFQDAHGRWPMSLDEALANGVDPPVSREYYDRDFVYRIVEGRPLLYAVGPNGVDDGGRGRPYEAQEEAGAAGDDVLFLAPGRPQ
jgi:tRNA A-37 threonylcarbamoyl transferase component Bud32